MNNCTSGGINLLSHFASRPEEGSLEATAISEEENVTAIIIDEDEKFDFPNNLRLDKAEDKAKTF